MTDYGSDLSFVDDCQDPEVIATGELNVANALARRLLTPTVAMAEIGDNAPYDSIDIREWLGRRFALSDRTVLDDLQQQCWQVMSQDKRVALVAVRATYAGGTLSIDVQATGTGGPFGFVLTVDGVTVALLRGS